MVDSFTVYHLLVLRNFVSSQRSASLVKITETVRDPANFIANRKPYIVALTDRRHIGLDSCMSSLPKSPKRMRKNTCCCGTIVRTLSLQLCQKSDDCGSMRCALQLHVNMRHCRQ